MFLMVEFQEAARKHQQQMAVLRAGGPWKSLPKWAPHNWSDKKNNCYNFALNRSSDYFLNPGYLSGSIVLPNKNNYGHFINQIHERALSDGLRYMGNDLINFDEKETPAALFFQYSKKCGERDAHWFALRKFKTDIVWAHKPGNYPAMVCVASIFNIASDNNYKQFAGYYAVPGRLGRINRKSHVLRSGKHVCRQAIGSIRKQLLPMREL